MGVGLTESYMYRQRLTGHILFRQVQIKFSKWFELQEYCLLSVIVEVGVVLKRTAVVDINI